MEVALLPDDALRLVLMHLQGPDIYALCLLGEKMKKKIFLLLFFARASWASSFSGPADTSDDEVFCASYWVDFLNVPSVAEDLKRIPFYRLQNGLAHLMQGFVRSLCLEGTLIQGRVVAHVKPSSKWSVQQRAVDNENKKSSLFYKVTLDVKRCELGSTTCGCPVG
jgi:hypothetical protein